jgi:hypothetical protein
MAMTWIIGIRGLHQPLLWKQMPLIPVWDAMAFALWLVSFGRDSIRWRGADYFIRNGQLVPALPGNKEYAGHHSQRAHTSSQTDTLL